MTTSRLRQPSQPSQPSQRPPPLGGADGAILLLSCVEGGCGWMHEIVKGSKQEDARRPLPFSTPECFAALAECMLNATNPQHRLPFLGSLYPNPNCAQVLTLPISPHTQYRQAFAPPPLPYHEPGSPSLRPTPQHEQGPRAAKVCKPSDLPSCSGVGVRVALSLFRSDVAHAHLPPPSHPLKDTCTPTHSSYQQQALPMQESRR